MNAMDVLDPLISLLLLAQEQPADAPGGGGPFEMLLAPWFPFIVIGVLFYFLLIRPERRKRADMTRMLDNLKKNDRVVTIGGIYGVVINAAKGAEDVTVRIDDSTNTRVRVLRSAISRVVTADEGEEKKGTS